jgi:hypothetical protein
MTIAKPVAAHNTLWEPPVDPWRNFRGGASPFPIVDGASDIDKRATTLWLAVERRRQNVAAVEQGQRDAQDAVALADDALQAELQRRAETGDSAATAQALYDKREACVAAANPELHNASKRTAEELAQQAVAEYLEFIDEHRWEFVAEIEDRAKKVAADWRRLNDETRKRLTPLEREHRELRSAVSFFLGNTEELTREDIPEDYAQPPLPTAHALARLEAAQPARAVHRAHELAT